MEFVANMINQNLQKRIGKCAQEDGFTLVEVILAFGLLAFMVSGIMLAVATSFASVTGTNDRAQAIMDGQAVINGIHASAAGAVAFPADTVAAFSAGVMNPNPSNLPNSQVTIAYEDPLANPLVVTVSVQYTTEKGYVVTEMLTTAVGNI